MKKKTLKYIINQNSEINEIKVSNSFQRTFIEVHEIWKTTKKRFISSDLINTTLTGK